MSAVAINTPVTTIIAFNLPCAMHHTFAVMPPGTVHASGSASTALLVSAGVILPTLGAVCCYKKTVKPGQPTYHSLVMVCSNFILLLGGPVYYWASHQIDVGRCFLFLFLSFAFCKGVLLHRPCIHTRITWGNQNPRRIPQRSSSWRY